MQPKYPIMAREQFKGRSDRSRNNEKKEKTGKSGKSGWQKPDGTPLRKRKGDYFPDQEIDKRKKGKQGTPPTERNNASTSGGTGEFTRGSERFSKKSTDGSFEKRGDFRNEKNSSERGATGQTSRKSGYSTVGKPGSEKSWFNRKGTDESNEKRGDFRNEKSISERGTTGQTSRKSGYSRGAKPEPEKPYSRQTEKPERKKPFEKKRERYADKDHSAEMRGRFSKKSAPVAGREGNKSFRQKSKTTPATKDGSVRLNRFISNAGICSRREADDLITAGVISINGNVVSELGIKVMPGDEVRFHDRILKTEKLVYVLLNKPKDFITTTDDPGDRKTVMNLLQGACKERIVPVGRLDRNTTGLLLLTNDGDLTRKLTHPSSNIKKLYQVELDKNVSQADMLRAIEGVELEDGVSGFDEIQYVSNEDKSVVGVELHSGKNRIVRRIFEALGYEVKKLDRTIFAGLTKKDLPRGRWRFLTEMEVSSLKMMRSK